MTGESAQRAALGAGAIVIDVLASNDGRLPHEKICLLYTSDAADERSSVDLGGRRILKKKNTEHIEGLAHPYNSEIQRGTVRVNNTSDYSTDRLNLA